MALVPAVIDALVARWRGAAELGGVQVLDGPEAKWPEGDLIAVGLSPEDLTTPAQRVPAGLVATSDSADITCLARSWTGDTLIKPRRDRAYQLLDIATALVEADRTLGGACSHAEVTGSLYVPAQTNRGVLTDVVFTVRAALF